MTHLTPGEFIDAMEGSLTADRQAHLDACEECQGRLEGVSVTLGNAKDVSVPEPSPLFWQHFSERVATAIDQDTAPNTNWRSWLRWRILVPLGAAAVIIVGLVIPRQNAMAPVAHVGPTAPVARDAPDARDAPAISDTWAMVIALVGEIDLDAASAAGVIEPGVAEEAVLQLTAEEQQELTRLLQAELQRAKS